MTDRPLGIRDLILVSSKEEPTRYHPTMTPECYFWCRRHEQAHKVGVPCELHLGTADGFWVAGSCIDIGPFMSEREASRLGGTEQQHRSHVPLGMEIEV